MPLCASLNTSIFVRDILVIWRLLIVSALDMKKCAKYAKIKKGPKVWKILK